MYFETPSNAGGQGLRRPRHHSWVSYCAQEERRKRRPPCSSNMSCVDILWWCIDWLGCSTIKSCLIRSRMVSGMEHERLSNGSWWIWSNPRRRPGVSFIEATHAQEPEQAVVAKGSKHVCGRRALATTPLHRPISILFPASRLPARFMLSVAL